MDSVRTFLVHGRLVVHRSPVDSVSVDQIVLERRSVLEKKNVRLRLVYFVVFPPQALRMC
jgi:hypothetical protein